MRRTIASHPVLACATLALGLGVGFEFLRAATDVGGQSLYWFATSWVYTAVEWTAVAVCVARVVRRSEDRLAWALMAFALACWSAGDLVWTVWLNYVADPPFPSLADGFYLLMYPSMYVSLMLLMRSRMRHAGVAHWLDGGVVGLTVAAIAVSIVFSDLVATAHGALVAEAVNLGYPVGDFVLLAFVAVAFTLANWRPGRMWTLIGVGVTTTAVADILYADQVASASYISPALLNALYLLGFSSLALAAWMPARRRVMIVAESPQTIIMTAIAAGFALALLVAGAFIKITPLAIVLAAAALVLACVRAGITYMENVRMLRNSAHEAVTDALSGLGNRRRLMDDLDLACKRARRAVPSTLIFFDLNGFKRYNDTFGHAAGDALLARIGASLKSAVNDHGIAYRLGGDEFCTLIEGRLSLQDPMISNLSGAMVERGSGFTIDASLGMASIPDDAPTPGAVLQLADERMYADKARLSRAQTRDVLLALLDERAPAMREDVGVVAALARAVAVELAVDADELDTVLRAAELHDVGKLAIPDEILTKPGPLDAQEWQFMKQHPAIGERILCAAPPLVPVARLVRAVHERWDGGGYPDGLAGEAIPLGARIVAACDAFCAMTSERCFRPKRSRQDAIDELRKCAGTQFDPRVVEVLCRTLESGMELTDAGQAHKSRLLGGLGTAAGGLGAAAGGLGTAAGGPAASPAPVG